MEKSPYLQQVDNLNAESKAAKRSALNDLLQQFRSQPPIAWGHNGTMMCDGEMVGIWVPVGRYNMSDTWFGPLIIIDDHARLYRAGRRFRHKRGRRVIRSLLSGPLDVADLSEKEADELRNRLREMINWRTFDD